MNNPISSNDPAKAPPPRGLTCPSCGCAHFLLVKITQARGYVRRRRACRYCGRRVTTSERIVGGDS